MKEEDVEDLEQEEFNDEDGLRGGRNKITIVGENYQLKQISDGATLWNLYFKRKNKKGEEKFVIESYGVSINQAIPKIINYMIAKKLNGQATTLKQYLKIWVKIHSQMVKELHSL